ncbi:hypothetical protein BDDG_13582 [Blastomyces dermatitidis ATCC 18188]|uniref:Uncharacterized protein n=1 Tax=Ajellomyces dermatitidis (strain ATCC 18188 / CBS 674.68) TaxID=653446 RepID=A0A0J9HJQ0_AJEDA|nr:hypothetical protein BDDG_13582 [Blastomyces dermatitidis ATCC 18188]
MTERAEDELNADESAGRRNDTSLQDAATTAAAARDAEEREDMAMKVILPQLINITVFTFNLSFLTVIEAAAAS